MRASLLLRTRRQIIRRVSLNPTNTAARKARICNRGLVSGCRCFGWWLIGIVAFAGEDLVAFLGGGNLDLAELAVPILVFGIVAEAVLVVQLVGDFVERGFEFIDTAHLEHAATG